MFDIVFEAHGLSFYVSSKKAAFNLDSHFGCAPMGNDSAKQATRLFRARTSRAKVATTGVRELPIKGLAIICIVTEAHSKQFPVPHASKVAQARLREIQQ